MTKQGFNILVETEHIDILVAYGKLNDTNNKTEAFRTAMKELKFLHHDKIMPILELMRKEKQLVKRNTQT